jgi:hypothetical protein
MELHGFRTHALPTFVSEVNVCAYFHHQMLVTDEWRCALQTAMAQASNYQYDQEPDEDPYFRYFKPLYEGSSERQHSCGVMRFHGFPAHINCDLTWLWEQLNGLLNVLQGMDCLLVQLLNSDYHPATTTDRNVKRTRCNVEIDSLDARVFLETALQFVDVWMWPIVMIFHEHAVSYVSMDFRRPDPHPMHKPLFQLTRTFSNLQRHPRVFRLLIDSLRTGKHFIDYMSEVEDDHDDDAWEGIITSLLHFVLQSNFVTDGTPIYDEMLNNLLIKTIVPSLEVHDYDWKIQMPVQLSKGHMHTGYHAYITLPDSKIDSMVAYNHKTTNRQLLCDRRLYNSEKTKETMNSLFDKKQKRKRRRRPMAQPQNV